MTDYTNIPWNDITHFGQKTLLKSHLFTVSWITTRYCNYECSYCWPYARSSVKDTKPLELYINTVNSIKAQAKNNGFTDYHFSFSGGEPTANKHFLPLVEHYCNDDAPEYQSIHMTTNLSPGSKWWNKYLEATKTLQRRSVTASFHDEFAKEQEFSDKCLQLMNGGVFVTINQVMVPEQFEEYYERCSRFADKGINVTLKPQSDPTASRVVDGYTSEQMKKLYNGMPQRAYTEQKRKWNDRPKPKFRVNEDDKYYQEHKSVPWHMQVEFRDTKGKQWYMDQAERFNAFNFNQFCGWECSSGFRSIIIREPDGSIKRSYSCHDAPLGNIETGFKLFDKPMPCITKSCVSSADSKIPKRKEGAKVPLYPGDKSYEKDIFHSS